MPSNATQWEAATRIAAEYDEDCRCTPNAGPSKALLVCACPGGRTVVFEEAGGILADSRDPAPLSRKILSGLEM